MCSFKLDTVNICTEIFINGSGWRRTLVIVGVCRAVSPVCTLVVVNLFGEQVATRRRTTAFLGTAMSTACTIGRGTCRSQEGRGQSLKRSRPSGWRTANRPYATRRAETAYTGSARSWVCMISMVPRPTTSSSQKKWLKVWVAAALTVQSFATPTRQWHLMHCTKTGKPQTNLAGCFP